MLRCGSQGLTSRLILSYSSPVMIVKPVMVYSILPPSSPSKKTSSCIVPSLSVTFFIIFPGDMVATYSSTWSTFFQCFQKGLARREFEILLIVVSFRHQGFRPPHLQKMINSLLYRVELGSAPFEWHLAMMMIMAMMVMSMWWWWWWRWWCLCIRLQPCAPLQSGYPWSRPVPADGRTFV